MNINIQLLDKLAKVPTQSREGDAAWDLVATSRTIEGKYVEYGTGIVVAIPEDHVGLLFPRSSVSNYDLNLANCVGVIDANYRGEVKLRFKTAIPVKEWNDQIGNPFDPGQDYDEIFKIYNVGDKVGQLIVIPRPYLEFNVVDNLNTTNRGAGGFGSSGK
jgi:dUTP pyrophosphatase